MTYEWNVTTKQSFLWTNMIVGEVFPTATTPSTWSVWQDYFSMLSMGGKPTIERIAGRPYLNYSLMYAFLLKVMRRHDRVMDMTRDSIGVPPPGVEVPPFPVSWRTVLLQVLVREVRNEMKKARLTKDAHRFLATVRGRCAELVPQVQTASADGLIALWRDEIRPLWKEIHPLQDKMNENLNRSTQRLKAEVTKAVGEDKATELLTTISSTGELASLGPLLGLAELGRGELSRDTYLRLYGHRGPNENELAEPRLYEAPDWLDRRLAEFDESPVDVAERLARRDAEQEALWQGIKASISPRQAQRIERTIREVTGANSVREATRSELTRLLAVIRALFLRAGQLAGLGDGVFFLTVDELIEVLSGHPSSAAQIDARRERYEAYRALPALPTWIRGHFDPFLWVADPNRRRDFYDADAPLPPIDSGADRIIRGQPGSAGRALGIVQRLDSPEEGDRLAPGEILVTSTTNVGWTPLFARTAAVITDVGGSLSHAAIVARELGIPAVVGCRDATVRLKTGDRVQVDGRRGTIEILERAA